MWDVKGVEEEVATIERTSFTLTMWDVKVFNTGNASSYH